MRRLLDPELLPAELIPGIRRILYGGAPTYVEDLREVVARFGPQRLWQGFGQGESPATITHLTPADHVDLPEAGALLSVGRARTGVEVRILLQDGGFAAPGRVGEVIVRGDTLMAGHWNT